MGNKNNDKSEPAFLMEDLRPFRDAEIPAAMRRIIDSPLLADMVNYTMPDKSPEEIKQLLLSFETVADFQIRFVVKVLENIMKATSSAFTTGGIENIDDAGHLYVSNHRDIILDGALFQMALLRLGLPTSEITFGSNLVSPGFVEDFGRSNRMYKILRGGNTRDLILNSRVLSEHLHETVADDRSIWISQRDGRTKDGNDRTDQGLVKMFAMAGGKDIRNSLKELNILPFAISYEYESCDALKTKELYIRRTTGSYSKAPGEDMRSIITGVKQYKGEVHIEICKPVSPEEIDALTGDNHNEIFRNAAALIDRRIISAYKLHRTNYMAYDMRRNTKMFADRYTAEDTIRFSEHASKQIASIGESIDVDKDELTNIFLDIYANPVQSKLDLESSRC